MKLTPHFPVRTQKVLSPHGGVTGDVGRCPKGQSPGSGEGSGPAVLDTREQPHSRLSCHPYAGLPRSVGSPLWGLYPALLQPHGTAGLGRDEARADISVLTAAVAMGLGCPIHPHLILL